MRRNLALASVCGFLGGCASHSCQRFQSSETAVCIPQEAKLGSLWYLSEVSEDEVGFRIGNPRNPDSVTVTLTRRELFCTASDEVARKLYCHPSAKEAGEDRQEHSVVRVYLDQGKSTWTYVYARLPGALPLAHCSALLHDPNVGRCVTDSIYKDLVYSAIFLDSRAGGVQKVWADVHSQIKRWEVPLE
jgi:hypothetical protein